MKKREIILHIFFCLSNTDFQNKTWFSNEQSDEYCSTFSETINSLDDFNFFEDVEDRKFDFSESMYSNLESFLNSVDDYEESENMLKDEKWLSLTAKAEKLYQEMMIIPVW